MESEEVAIAPGQADLAYGAYINSTNKRILSLCIRYCLRNIMCLRFIIFLIVGAAVADHHHAWRTGNEYHFLVQSRTLTTLDKLHQQFSGILMKGVLVVQVKSPDTLQATISKPQYVSVHQVLPEGWESKIPEQTLDFDELPLSGKPFEIKTKHGVIRDLLIDQKVPTWEINLVKSIVSQLQIDTQGENALKSKSIQVPDDEQPFAMFKAMEDSVGGKCEVLYDITPLSEEIRLNNPELVPLPNLRGDGYHLDITKTKNYTKCEQRMAYNFGVNNEPSWKPGSNDGYFSRFSTSRIVVSGNMKHFTIQSSVTTNKIFVSSKIQETHSGAVYSRMNITLNKINKISNPVSISDNLVSTGNLVYMYNSPFSNHEQRKPRRPSISQNSLPAQSSESRSSNSSSEESNNDDSSSSSSSSSSASNDEKSDYLQPKPTLDEVPDNPLLPYFIGYKGKSVQKSEKEYTVEAGSLIASMAEQISNEHMKSEFTEEADRFTILIRLIRTMNSKQIAEVESKLPTLIYQISESFAEEEKKVFDQVTWNILYNAVAHAGTGPALITVTNWIKNEKLEGIEAARIISKIPKIARTPTAEYIKAFFQLTTDPDVLKQRYLNVSAPLAFAELVCNARVSKTYYPVYSFGPMLSKHDNTLLETYIPYMANQLRKAIEEGDSTRIQTYSTALGMFGHPNILSVLEPYLEGTQPVTKFQRLIMVLSLSKLTETTPRIARSVLYKIYINVMEAHEVRCAAVYLLMKTNPPLSMLQRMAEFTNHDESRQVNSAVKTTIESLAKMKQPELQDLANKARIAKKLLSSQHYGSEYSRGHLADSVVMNIASKFLMYTIGSDDSDIFKAVYLGGHMSYGGFNLPDTKMMYAVSSIKQLLNIWDQSDEEDKASKKLILEKIAHALNIQPENPEQLEGNIFVESMYGSQFYPFDNHTVERIENMLKEYLLPSMNPGTLQSKSIINLDSYDATVGFPTETGLPFVYTLRVPKIIKLDGGGSYDIKFSNGFAIDATVNSRIKLIEKIQNRIGFITPFEHKHYIAGIDVNSQISLPIDFRVKWEAATKSFYMKIDSSHRFMTVFAAYQFNIIPYTAKHDILDLQPVLFDKNTSIVRTGIPYNKISGIGDIIVSAEIDNYDSESSLKTKFDSYDKILRNGLDAHYKNIEMVRFSKPIEINVTYDSMEIDGSEYEQSWPKKATVPMKVDKQPNSEARRDQFLKEVGKDINSATAYVLDVNLHISDLSFQQVLTLGWATSNVDEKSRGFFYWNVQPEVTRSDGNIHYEICAAGQTRSLQDILLNYEKVIEREPKNEFNVALLLGQCDKDGEKIELEGTLTQIYDLKEMAMNSEIAGKCRQEMKQGNKGLRACQQASALASRMNHLMMSMDISRFVEPFNKITDLFRENVAFNKNMKISRDRNEDEKKTVDIEMKLSPNGEKITEISLYIPKLNITFSPSPELLGRGFDDDDDDDDDDDSEEDEDEASCTIDKTKAVTFDDKVYPLKLGKCWYVMMTTYAQRYPDNPDKFLPIPEELRVAVKVREMDDGSKEVNMILGDKEIHLQKSDDRLEATVDGQKIKYSQYTSYRDKLEDETIFEIFELPDKSIRIISDTYEVKAVYDGERIRLEISDEYRNAVRGLCGTYDKRSNNDFTTPQNCILRKPEEFSATYALAQDDCQELRLRNKPKAEQSTCVLTYRQSNVISDREAGRLSIESRKWGYH